MCSWSSHLSLELWHVTFNSESEDFNFILQGFTYVEWRVAFDYSLLQWFLDLVLSSWISKGHFSSLQLLRNRVIHKSESRVFLGFIQSWNCALQSQFKDNFFFWFHVGYSACWRRARLSQSEFDRFLNWIWLKFLFRNSVPLVIYSSILFGSIEHCLFRECLLISFHS